MKIAIVTGGETGERDVSIRSAKNVADLIDFAEVTTFVFPDETADFIRRCAEFDLAIPVIHGLGGEDGSAQGLFKNLNIPFLFSDIGAHAVAMDKCFTKEVVASIGIQSPKNTKEFPAFVKPRNGGSSVASMLCKTESDYSILATQYPGLEFMTEQPVRGREFTVGVIERGKQAVVLPVVEIIPRGEFFDYENKYDPKKLATEICPAEIDETLAAELKRQAITAHTHLGIRHISRCDFIVTPDNEIYFLEINTIPGMTDTSLVPKMIQTAGLSMRDLLKEWCDEVSD